MVPFIAEPISEIEFGKARGCSWKLLALPQAVEMAKQGILRKFARRVFQVVVPGREAGNHHWWRRGDSTSTAFAAGWTMPSSARSNERVDAERVIPLTSQWDPSARPGFRLRRVYESLQGRPEVGPLPTPRRCHAILREKDAVRFHRCELRYQPTLTGWCDPRSNPRPQALDTKTYVRSSLIVFSLRATRGAGKTLGQPLSLFAIRPETHRSAIL